VHGLVKWTEERSSSGGSAAEENHVAYFKWQESGEAQIIFRFPSQNLGGRRIQFDIADCDTERVEAGDTAPLDGKIVMKDAAGNEAAVQISSYAVLYPPLPVQLYKVDALTGAQEWKYQMQTVSVDTADFLQENPALDLARITSITLVLEGSGEINLDNVGLQ
jgi:hypothetical protein